MEIRNLKVYADEAGQFQEEERSSMVALLTNGTRHSENHISSFVGGMHSKYGLDWKSKDWKQVDVVRLTALIRAKGWLVLRGWFQPPERETTHFLDYIKANPEFDPATRDRMVNEVTTFPGHVRRWFLSLYDILQSIYQNGRIAAGHWVFDQRQEPSQGIIPYYLHFAMSAMMPPAHAAKFIQQYSHIPVKNLFQCNYASRKTEPGLRLADYCASFFHRTKIEYTDQATVDMSAFQLNERVLKCPGHATAILPVTTDIPLWLDMVAENYLAFEKDGLEAARAIATAEPHRLRVLKWMEESRFFGVPATAEGSS